MRGCRPLTEMEYMAVKAHANARELCLLVLGVRTGFRISELLSLNVEDVLGEYVYLKKSNSKGKVEGRKMVLHIEAKNVIRNYVGDRTNGPLFLNRYGDRLKRCNADRALDRTFIRANIDMSCIGTHTLRKTFASMMWTATQGNLLKMQRLMGHKNVNSTVSYLSVDENELFQLVKSQK